MGQNSRAIQAIKIFSKARIAVGLAALVIIFLAPFLAWAQSASDTWTSDECGKVGGVWLEVSQGKYDCFAKETASPITISVGSVSGSATLTKYIASFYKYLTAAAAVLAVIYIMVGGFQILFSAGGEQVGEGRKKITNAILGLVLVFCSYILLQTVNPALVNLQSPRIKLVKAAYLGALGGGMGSGTACWTGSDEAACTASCSGCHCVVIKDPPSVGVVTGITYVSLAIVPALTVGAAAVGAGAGATLSLIGHGIAKGASYVWSAAKVVYGAASVAGGGGVTGAATTAGVVTLAASLWPSDGKGERGVCLALADHDIPKGGICSSDVGCVSGKCLITSESLAVGFCVVSDGTVDSICSSAADCKKVAGDTVGCVSTVSDKYKKCTDGKAGSPCGKNEDCQGGNKCDTSTYLCSPAAGLGAENSACTTKNDCMASAANCIIFSGSTSGKCSSLKEGSLCGSNGASVCADPGLTCLAPCDLFNNYCQGYCYKKSAGGDCFLNKDCPVGTACSGANPSGGIYGVCK